MFALTTLEGFWDMSQFGSLLLHLSIHCLYRLVGRAMIHSPLSHSLTISIATQ